MKKKDDNQYKKIPSKNIVDDELSSIKAQINDIHAEINLPKETIRILKSSKISLPLTRMDTEDKIVILKGSVQKRIFS